MFNLFRRKREKPTLLSDIKKSSDWILNALNHSGYAVNMSIDSVKELERFFTEHVDE